MNFLYPGQGLGAEEFKLFEFSCSDQVKNIPGYFLLYCSIHSYMFNPFSL